MLEDQVSPEFVEHADNEREGIPRQLLLDGVIDATEAIVAIQQFLQQ